MFFRFKFHTICAWMCIPLVALLKNVWCCHLAFYFEVRDIILVVIQIFLTLNEINKKARWINITQRREGIFKINSGSYVFSTTSLLKEYMKTTGVMRTRRSAVSL